MEKEPQREVYIASGAKNAMYTLRVSTWRAEGGFGSDNYIMNLSNDPKKAEAKAKIYFDNNYPNADFLGFADFDLNAWGAPSKIEQEQITAIEDGYIPFGKHAGEKIADLSDGYVLWWADQDTDENTMRPAAALIACMKGEASSRGLYAKREAKQAERAKIEAQRVSNSHHIGAIGERREFTGKVVFVTSGDGNFGTWFLTGLDTAEGFVLYWNTLSTTVENFVVNAKAGDVVTFHARIKDHGERDGVKQTIVSRATKIKIQKEAA